MSIPNIPHDAVYVFVYHMAEILVFADLCQFQSADIEIILAGIVLLHDLLPCGFQYRIGVPENGDAGPLPGYPPGCVGLHHGILLNRQYVMTSNL